MTLVWRESAHGEIWKGLSGREPIAMIMLEDGNYWWSLYGLALVDNRGGFDTNLDVAKRQAEKRWTRWLKRAGLYVPDPVAEMLADIVKFDGIEVHDDQLKTEPLKGLVTAGKVSVSAGRGPGRAWHRVEAA